MNQKHKNVTEEGASIAAWFPGNLISEIDAAVAATGQKRSFVIAEAVRLGLSAVKRKLPKPDGGNGHKKDEGPGGLSAAGAGVRTRKSTKAKR